MDDPAKSGEEIFSSFSSKVLDERASAASPGFAREMKDLAIETIFSKLWARPGLSARDRSLVTISILIALRAADELKVHTAIGLKNGLTIAELEEIIYHSSGYAGFPAAATAMASMTEALRTEGLID
ncbi:carboxymuconolactone decarboxylase family protein [Novosphingobium pentaromativorans]|uniref:Carboxymuconolactone decarboxylase n=1 Tax=Novosphingobium pentaromativorans US6-1 TaxID=1088721 RepID=G6ECL6_9SPHN|nr:carboxymuconolactone decarboxylase family protein [Novosphingobium pentaromativorans]AIT80023.1 carboxymuconolactone decarboxylase [Novosphingobium pentaromativorans US6-1]EHJ60927.1 Carboxymuconolactone decarboxylase [Novosphingobium pentaromativorans US6-1]